jgi:hypothetical protein
MPRRGLTQAELEAYAAIGRAARQLKKAEEEAKAEYQASLRRAEQVQLSLNGPKPKGAKQ